MRLRRWHPRKSKPSRPRERSTVLVFSGCSSSPSRVSTVLTRRRASSTCAFVSHMHHEVVGIADQRAEMRTPVLPHPVEDMQVDVREQRRDDAALRRARHRRASTAPPPSHLPRATAAAASAPAGPRCVAPPAPATRCGRCCRSSRECRRPARGCRRARRARAAFPVPASRSASAETHTTTARKSASKMGSSTSVAAICATRSRTVGMPSGRCRPSAFGMYRRRTGCGRYVPARSAAPSSSSRRSTPYCSTAARVIASTPAAPRFVFTRRHASWRTSALQIRSIRAWKRRSGDRLAATQSRRCNWRTWSMGGGPPG